jgi:hypothetical protein
MKATTSRLVIRSVVGPIAVAGFIVGATGFAAAANATTTPPAHPHMLIASELHAKQQAEGTPTAGHMPAGWTDTLRNYRDKWADSQKQLQTSTSAAH